jgi:hypothetical protein
MNPAGRLTSHRRAPSLAITYVLQAPNGITLKPGGPHVLGVTQDTYLSDLWQRVKPFLQQGKGELGAFMPPVRHIALRAGKADPAMP